MNSELLGELLALRQRDIDMRDRLLNEGNLYGDYAPAMQAVHRENAHALEELVSRHGWPGVSLVGPEGCRAAWLVRRGAWSLLATGLLLGKCPPSTYSSSGR